MSVDHRNTDRENIMEIGRMIDAIGVGTFASWRKNTYTPCSECERRIRQYADLADRYIKLKEERDD